MKHAGPDYRYSYPSTDITHTHTHSLQSAFGNHLVQFKASFGSVRGFRESVCACVCERESVCVCACVRESVCVRV